MFQLRTETDPVSGTLCFPVFRIQDDGRSPETQQMTTCTLLMNLTENTLEPYLIPVFKIIEGALFPHKFPINHHRKMDIQDNIVINC
jgi:hypothetical protein